MTLEEIARGYAEWRLGRATADEIYQRACLLPHVEVSGVARKVIKEEDMACERSYQRMRTAKDALREDYFHEAMAFMEHGY